MSDTESGKSGQDGQNRPNREPDATPRPAATNLFLELTPERVLDAVERAGYQTRPVCYPLNSFENRVYEVELADRSRVVAKFYRPERWVDAQILEEHRFLTQLEEDELPVCGVLPFPDGSTLQRLDDRIPYCLFERRAGRAIDELDDAAVERLGMLVGRIHTVGAREEAKYRLRLDADNFVRPALQWLEQNDVLPAAVANRYLTAGRAIAEILDTELAGVAMQRIHGDLHLGNILFREGRLRFLDFDDMVVGPPVQDLWLALPGRDVDTSRQYEVFLEGYTRFRDFDRSTLRLIEPLRALRIIHFSTWLAKRWHDPIFPATWTDFGTESYWLDETRSLEEQLDRVRRSLSPTPIARPEVALDNSEYFWDWEEPDA